MHRLLTLLFFFYTPALFGQYQISGKVTDSHGEPLPFVNILINDSPFDGGTSNIDGLFVLESEVPIEVITLTYVGYEMLRLPLDPNRTNTDLNIQLQKTAYELVEAVVIAGENPAHRIIRAAIKNRAQNNPEKLNAYECRIYNKLVANWIADTNGLHENVKKEGFLKKLRDRQYKNIKREAEHSGDRYLMLMESISERHFKSPDNYARKVLLNRVSGFKSPQIIALVNEFQPFSFYKNFISILDQDYVNPISPGSTSRYFFQLQDTLYQGQDSIFIISFEPRKGKTFDALKGLVYIHTHRFAIKNVIAEPADSVILHMKLEQQYQMVDDQWFPEQLNFELSLPNYPSEFLGTFMQGKSYIDSVLVNHQPEASVFKGNEAYYLAPGVNNWTDSLWQKIRPEPLNEKEQGTYSFMDSLGEARNYDKKMKLISGLSVGLLPLGKLDVELDRLLQFNDFEGTRLGIGLTTNDSLSRYFRLSGYTGFGIKDKRWKYGSDIAWKFVPEKDMELGITYRNDLQEPTITNDPFAEFFVSRRFYAQRMDAMEELAAHLKGNILKYGQIQFGIAQQKVKPLYLDSFYLPGEVPEQSFQFTALTFNLRYAHREQIVRFMGRKIPTGFDHLVFQVGLEKGIKGLGQGAYNYDRWTASVRHTFLTRRLGETSFLLESGMVTPGTPYSKLFSSSGIGRGFQVFAFENIFQTMDLYEFLSDRYVHLFFRQHLGAIAKGKYMAPEITLVHNMGWGELQQQEHLPAIPFQTMENGYYESGLILSNLIRINYLNFLRIGIGIGSYYRYGPSAFDRWKDNLAFRLDLRVGT